MQTQYPCICHLNNLYLPSTDPMSMCLSLPISHPHLVHIHCHHVCHFNNFYLSYANSLFPVCCFQYLTLTLYRSLIPMSITSTIYTCPVQIPCPCVCCFQYLILALYRSHVPMSVTSAPHTCLKVVQVEKCQGVVVQWRDTFLQRGEEVILA